VLSLLAATACLLGLPHWQPSGDALWAQVVRRSEWWSIDQAGSVGQTLLFGLGSAQCFLCYQIYHLRRHRSDDYHGAYQVWWWALFPASGLAIANMGVPTQLLAFLVQPLEPSSGLGLWSALTLSVAGCLILGLAVRLYYEVSDSRWSTVGLVAAAIAFVGYTAVAVNARFDLGLPRQWDAVLQPSAWWLIANVLLTCTLLFYLSYVYRDVLGHVAVAAEDPLVKAVTPPAVTPPVVEKPLSGESQSKNQRATSGDSTPGAVVATAAAVEEESPLETQDNGILARRKRRRAA
jgi:hypothetical protein